MEILKKSSENDQSTVHFQSFFFDPKSDFFPVNQPIKNSGRSMHVSVQSELLVYVYYAVRAHTLLKIFKVTPDNFSYVIMLTHVP